MIKTSLLGLVLCSISTFGVADTAPVAQPAAEVKIGPETKLPLPRFVSLKAKKGNVRRGPALTHRIDWVFKHRDMPLQVIAEHGHWRKVIDRDGAGGWMHYALLSGSRHVIVQTALLNIHQRPQTTSPTVARFERDVIARLGDCTLTWCQISQDGYKGWAPKDKLWGVLPDEIRE